MTHACWRSGKNDGSWFEGCTLRAKADNFGNTENEVTMKRLVHVRSHYWELHAYSNPQSCKTFPFLRPRILRAPGSGTAAAETSTGPNASQFFPKFLSPREICLHGLTNRTCPVKSFREGPLTLRKLACTSRDIVGGRISQNIFHCGRLGNVLCQTTDNNYKLRFIVCAVIL